SGHLSRGVWRFNAADNAADNYVCRSERLSRGVWQLALGSFRLSPSARRIRDYSLSYQAADHFVSSPGVIVGYPAFSSTIARAFSALTNALLHAVRSWRRSAMSIA